MKEQTTKFKCDCEGCKETTTIEGGLFPYDAGWVYLYNLNFKTDPKKVNEFKDKHFCGVKCMTTFINIKISECAKSG